MLGSYALVTMVILFWCRMHDVTTFPYPPTVVLSYRALIMLLFVIIYHVRVHTYSCASYWLVFLHQICCFPSMLTRCVAWRRFECRTLTCSILIGSLFWCMTCNRKPRLFLAGGSEGHAHFLMEVLTDTPPFWWNIVFLTDVFSTHVSLNLPDLTLRRVFGITFILYFI